MSKQNKRQSLELDDEFFAQLNFLRNDYDAALETIEQQKQDIQKLLSLLIERGIPVPGSIIDRYIKRAVQMQDLISLNFRSINYNVKWWSNYSATKKLKNLHALLDKPNHSAFHPNRFLTCKEKPASGSFPQMPAFFALPYFVWPKLYVCTIM